MKSISQDEFLAEAKARFGDKGPQLEVCLPACGTMQSVQQLQDAVVASGGTKDDVHRYIAFSCIDVGLTNQGDAGRSQPKEQGPALGQGATGLLEDCLESTHSKS